MFPGTTCGVNITTFLKKLVMCAEEASQMAVHIYQYTAGGVPVQCILKYHVAKTKKYVKSVTVALRHSRVVTRSFDRFPSLHY